MKTTAPYAGTQAVRRAVELLKSFPAAHPERSLTELALTVGLNRTTAYRLLTALQSEGMIERAGSVYRLGPEMLALGARAASASHLRSASRGELTNLALETGETATIEVLVGRDALILDEAIGHYLVGTVASLGTRWPAHATSTGKVLLAFATEDVVADFLAEPLVRLTPKTIVDPIQFRRELGRVRDRGHAVTGEEVELGFVAVSVPVLGEGGIAVAALSVGGPKARFPADRTGPLADTLRAAALRIAGRLGYRASVRPPAAPARGRRG